MLTPKDWLISLMSNLLFLAILVLIMYHSGLLFSKEKKDFVVELTSAENLVLRNQTGGDKSDNPFDDVIPAPSEINDLPKSEAVPFLPQEAVPLSLEKTETEWVTYNTDIPDMPADPLPYLYESDLFDDPLLSQRDTDDNRSSGAQPWSFSWDDGEERVIQYIPAWDYYVNREISQQLDRCMVTFQISSEGYVFNIQSEDSISLNEAWFTLLENWLSRIVFEPGYEGQGSLTLVFGNSNI